MIYTAVSEFEETDSELAKYTIQSLHLEIKKLRAIYNRDLDRQVDIIEEYENKVDKIIKIIKDTSIDDSTACKMILDIVGGDEEE